MKQSRVERWLSKIGRIVARFTKTEPDRSFPRAVCPECGRVVAVTKTGRPWGHRCTGQ